MNNPVTDIHLGIAKDSSIERFADVRHKAKQEEVERYGGLKKKKKMGPQPEFSIDQRVVVAHSGRVSAGERFQVRIVDTYLDYGAKLDRWQYFGVIERVTHEKSIPLIGHIVKVVMQGWLLEYIVQNVMVEVLM